MIVMVMSSDKTNYLLPGFFHQWAKHAGTLNAVTTLKMVVSQTRLFQPPTGWTTFIAGADNLQANWTGHLLKALKWIQNDRYVLLLMDDYWLCQAVDVQRCNDALHLMQRAGDIHKIDLSGDRQGFAHTDHIDGYVRSKNDADYLTSTQAAIWRKDFLVECAHDPAWTPWQFELTGTDRIRGGDWRILGQVPPSIQYANVSLRNVKELRLGRLTKKDLAGLKKIGAIPCL